MTETKQRATGEYKLMKGMLEQRESGEYFLLLSSHHIAMSPSFH